MGLLTVKEVTQRTTLSRMTIHRKVRAGTFPQPVRPAPGRIAWRAKDVDKWIEKLGVTA